MSSEKILFVSFCTYNSLENVFSRKNRTPLIKKKKGFASSPNEPDMKSITIPIVGIAGPTDVSFTAQSALHDSLTPLKLE